jgi:hypothetical protein
MKGAPGLNCPANEGVERTILHVVDSGRGCHYDYFGPFYEKQRLGINRAEAAISKLPAEVMKTSGGASNLLRS